MQAPQYITYQDIQIPDISQEPFNGNRESIEQFLIDFQGSYINILPDSHTVSALKLFKDIQDVVDELVFSTKSGQKYLLLSHPDDNVIRDNEIIVDYLDTEIDKDSLGEERQPYSIDLAAMWSYGDSFTKDDIDNFLPEFFAKIHPTENLTLVGSAPLPILFFAGLLLRTTVGELWYQIDSHSEPIKIF